jgi:chloride channel 7
MTVYYGPGANGSGVAELIGYLNGVNYPGFITWPTLFTKIIGVALAVSGRLCIGKEGPLCHIGAVWGALVIYVPFIDLRHLQNDDSKRVLVAAGASAGVSVAFGAPIGGALFIYELSRPNTFWKFKMLWKVFYSCCIACFTLAIWTGLVSGKFGDWSGASLKFGNLKDVVIVDLLILLPAAFIIGIIGGLMGALFININSRVNVYRGKWITKKWQKPPETFFFCFLTASVFFWVPYWFNRTHCVVEPDNIEEI